MGRFVKSATAFDTSRTRRPRLYQPVVVAQSGKIDS
jgi:hypothetical protein